MSRFLKVLAFCFCIIVTGNAFAAGYSCPTYKKYTSCVANRYLTSTSTGNACNACGANSSNPAGNSNTYCTCNAGYMNSSGTVGGTVTGGAACTVAARTCAAGNYWNGSACAACGAANYYCPGFTNVTNPASGYGRNAVTAGYYTTGGTGATNRTGQAACGGNQYYCSGGVRNNVSAGYYSTGGTSTTRTGQAQCGTGTYCSAGVSTACTNKPANCTVTTLNTHYSYATSSGLTSNACPINVLAAGVPAGKYVTSNGTSSANCTSACAAGRYGAAGKLRTANTCDGACTNTATSCGTKGTGWNYSGSGAASATACPITVAAAGVPGGKWVSGQGGAAPSCANNCAAGRYGAAGKLRTANTCDGACGTGTYSGAGAASCSACTNKPTNCNQTLTTHFTYATSSALTSNACPINVIAAGVPAGKYVTSNGTSSANCTSACAAGYYGAAGKLRTANTCDGACTNTPASCGATKGTHWNYSGSGAASATACPITVVAAGVPAGKYVANQSTATANCSNNCAAGRYGAAGKLRTANTCDGACGTGTYSGAGAASCSACTNKPANCTVTTLNTHYSYATSSALTSNACPINVLAAGVPATKYVSSNGTASANCTSTCTAGRYGAAGVLRTAATCDGACTNKPANCNQTLTTHFTYSSAGSSATTCNINVIAAGVPAGKYVTSNGTTSANCTSSCSAGYYGAAGKLRTAATCDGACTSGNYSLAGAASCSACSGLGTTGQSPTGGTYSSVSPFNAATTCRYTAPAKTITGCSAVTASTVSWSGTSWSATTYTVTAGAGYAATNSGTASATCTQCVAGTASAAGVATCSACTGATYSGAGAASCSACPSGYTANTANNKTAASQCQISCAAGTRVAAVAGACASPAGGWYTAAHSVNYGQISPVNYCMAGFTSSGTTAATHDAATDCTKSIAAGQYIGANTRTARYIRIASNGSTANTGNHVVEVQAFAASNGTGTNLLSGKAAVTQSSNGAAATDGSWVRTNYANCAATTGCVWDLGSVQTIGSIKFALYTDGRTYSSVAVYTSTDNVNWVTVFGPQSLLTQNSATAVGETIVLSSLESNCAAGTARAAHTVALTGTSTCSTCTAGTYSLAKAGSCSACTNTPANCNSTKGTHWNYSGSGATSATACPITVVAAGVPAMKYVSSNGTATANCTSTCTAGRYGAAGVLRTAATCDGACTNVPSGCAGTTAGTHFNYTSAGSSATTCNITLLAAGQPAAKYVSGQGTASVSCPACTTGQYGAAGGTIRTTAACTGACTNVPASCLGTTKGTHFNYANAGSSATTCNINVLAAAVPAAKYVTGQGGTVPNCATSCTNGRYGAAGVLRTAATCDGACTNTPASCAGTTVGTHFNYASAGSSATTCNINVVAAGVPGGKYVSSQGGTAPSCANNCSAGRYGAAGVLRTAATCDGACAAGTYSLAGAASCSACTNTPANCNSTKGTHWNYSGSGATSATACPITVVAAGVPAMKYVSSNGTATANCTSTCTAGRYGAAGVLRTAATCDGACTNVPVSCAGTTVGTHFNYASAGSSATTCNINVVAAGVPAAKYVTGQGGTAPSCASSCSNGRYGAAGVLRTAATCDGACTNVPSGCAGTTAGTHFNYTGTGATATSCAITLLAAGQPAAKYVSGQGTASVSCPACTTGQYGAAGGTIRTTAACTGACTNVPASCLGTTKGTHFNYANAGSSATTCNINVLAAAVPAAKYVTGQGGTAPSCATSCTNGRYGAAGVLRTAATCDGACTNTPASCAGTTVGTHFNYASAGSSATTCNINVAAAGVPAAKYVSGQGGTAPSCANNCNNGTYGAAGVLRTAATCTGACTNKPAAATYTGNAATATTCPWNLTCAAGQYFVYNATETSRACSTCTSGNYCLGVTANRSTAANAGATACSGLGTTGQSPTGGTYSSVSPFNAATTCRYTAPTKTITGCSAVTSNPMPWSGTAWSATTYTVTAGGGYAATNSGTVGATCTQCVAGTASAAGAATCTACTGTNYSGAGAAACTACPNSATGYYDYNGKGQDSIYKCYKRVAWTSATPNGTGTSNCYYTSGTGTSAVYAGNGSNGAGQCDSHSATACNGGYYYVSGNVCTAVGTGHWSAASVLTRTACGTGLTTTGSGAGADEAGDCGRVLHMGSNTLRLRSEKKTTPSLNINIGGTKYYGNMSTATKGALRINSGGTKYSVYDDSM